MKQKTKNTLHALFHSLLFGAVILAVAAIYQSEPSTPALPVQPSPKTSVSQPSEQTKAMAVLASQNTESPAVALPTSPKHDEIKQFVTHEYEYRMFAAPNDPLYQANWTFAKVNAPAAWDMATGNGQTTVAVIDTGFALAHEDLATQWATNSGETGTTQADEQCWTGIALSKQSNNCDDDNNGYIDDWRGWNFIQNSNNPQTGQANIAGIGTQHGTQVAGIVGASSNNSVGIAAINWNTKLMPLQALSDDGIGYTSGIMAAIYYAVDNGASVINLSLGAYANDPALINAVNYATARSVVIVAAAGNCGEGASEECSGLPVGTVAYPAAYPNVIAVGATTQSDQRAGFSSYGPSIDISAPGYSVPSSTSWSASNPTSLYSGTLYGTSFSSPQVASLAALIKSIRPSTSVADITAIIDATATKPASMNNLFYSDQFGHGIINAAVALSIANALNSSATSIPTLLQAGSSLSEHSSPSGTIIGSGCQSSSGACTVQMTDSSQYKRFLPYSLVSSGSTGWSWSSDSLDTDNWEIRARVGDTISSTPYYLLKKS